MSAEEIKYPTLSVTVAPISTKDPRREKERTENQLVASYLIC